MPSNISSNTAETDATLVFVVLTEDYYGGEHLIRLFTHSDHAIQYTTTLPLNSDVTIIDTHVSGVLYNNTVFVVVTEQDYGGGDSKVKVFSTKHEADNYAEHVGTQYNLDTLVIQQTLM